MPKATSTQLVWITAGNGENLLTSHATPPPMAIPSSPPVPVRVIASVRNCHRMSRFLAPSALRTPISRVRSVTETSMMFITPTPPTTSPIDEIAIITM